MVPLPPTTRSLLPLVSPSPLASPHLSPLPLKLPSPPPLLLPSAPLFKVPSSWDFPRGKLKGVVVPSLGLAALHSMTLGKGLSGSLRLVAPMGKNSQVGITSMEVTVGKGCDCS